MAIFPNDSEMMDQFIAGCGPLAADLAASEEMDAGRLARLIVRLECHASAMPMQGGE